MVRAIMDMEPVQEEACAGPDKSPLYLRIRDVLAEAISAGRLPRGALLLEGPVAALFVSTRTPVRQAFALLEAAGAIRRFDDVNALREQLERDGERARAVLAAATGDLDAPFPAPE